MQCRVFNMTTGKEEHTTDLLVLARAYHAAWRSIYTAEPAGWHRIMTLGIVLDFGQRDPDPNDVPDTGTPNVGSGSPSSQGIPGERREK